MNEDMNTYIREHPKSATLKSSPKQVARLKTSEPNSSALYAIKEEQ